MLTGLEKKLAEEQVFQVEDLVLLRDEGMLQTVFSKHVTRRKVEMALALACIACIDLTPRIVWGKPWTQDRGGRVCKSVEDAVRSMPHAPKEATLLRCPYYHPARILQPATLSAVCVLMPLKHQANPSPHVRHLCVDVLVWQPRFQALL